jgi:elongation factor Ts
MMDCKKALVECGGDIDKAVDYLREKGLAKAAKKADRNASQGMIFSYIHSNAKLGVLLELSCETDFVARTEEFRTLGHEIAMQIAASNPSYIRREDVPAEVAEHEAEVIKAQAREEGKPEKMLDKIAEGRLNKFYEENCLLEQRYIRDPDKKINDLIIENIAKMGENIVVRRFARFMIES